MAMRAKRLHMRKSVTSTMPTPIKFGALVPEVVERIDHNDAVHSASSAHYRFESRMQSVRRQYDTEAAKIRAGYLAEIGAPNGGGEVE